jgi:hypothetical protein
MDPARWQQIEAMFEQALDMPADTREAWLAEACTGDPVLHDEVAALLASTADAGAALQTCSDDQKFPPKPTWVRRVGSTRQMSGKKRRGPRLSR